MDKERCQMMQKEIFRHHPESRQLIVFIHGIIEGPKQFRRLAQIAYEEGYSIYMMLLPGHGGSSRAFEKNSYKKWVEYVSLRLKKMKGLYEGIILTGHSMGALLAVCEAVCLKEQIQALVLIDSPLCICLWPRVIIGAVKIKNGRVDNEYTEAEWHAISIRGLNGCDYLKWLLRYWELFSLIRFTRRKVKMIQQPLLLVFSRKDEFVRLRSRRYFKHKAEMTEIVLEDSGHFCYHHEDLLYLEEHFRKFIQNQKRD